MPKKKKMKHLFICVPARIEDLSTVLMIQNECFPDNEKTLKWLMQKLVQERTNYICYVVKIMGTDRVVGYMLAKANERGEADIVSIGVTVMYRRLGVGRLLLAHFLDEASGVILRVSVDVPDTSDTLAAQLFLRDCGFPESRIDRKKQTIKFKRSLV